MIPVGNNTNITMPAGAKNSVGSTIASACFIVIVMLLTIMGNLLVCYSVFYYRRLRSPTNYLVVSLAVSDLLVGTLSLPFRLAQLLNEENWPSHLGREGCQFWIWVDMLCSGASMVNLAGISFDRLLAIKQPLRYREKMTSKRALILILVVWIYAASCAFLSFVEWEGESTIAAYPQCGIRARVYITLMALAAFFCPLLIVIICYGMVLQVAIRHALQVQKEKEQIALNVSPEPNSNNHEESGETSLASPPVIRLKTSRSSSHRKDINFANGHAKHRNPASSTFHIMKQIKATKTLAVVVGVFILCWFPFFVIFVTFQYCDTECFGEERIPPAVKRVLLIIFVYVLPVSNSAANPIIYSCFNQEFRVAFLKIFYKMVGKRYRQKYDYYSTPTAYS
ncbi:predicted protein [Nematostella vectensis]|uniref:G-protein coupled receptors family 1 profile domain-containing protein n=1 Tax=Nematostella vectensis TaxID=45351 RepID=A7RMJ9_NEMVE|nr:tyramine receptor 1 [Nematostella vectensis]XP_032220252.1 tyramine receptor 1 [Nematostella vectensis]XP_032220253.1 tyramine receptor 1 [Nematostella vectensis]XP_032220254.1 tyramine receptor 1 [Nematostella vectensis]XP_032220255.1 tyramine receptor 1 [Nematostella vectensis]XP_032220256.1 tyramine receptor 1 [Nematostella vectensis]XP_032220257.1 tyramine receptor 1 [Nematostella vectensis]XP_032220258.1 tyramine receptor 1 [Nematostella vectensis]XP_032220259.1 tyramine receptor 1 |eukprot:XP_001639422.1 predicted protein [Nematostella vectensis]